MAFESFRKREEQHPRRRRQISFVLVAILHVALIAAGVAYSYWNIDELTPPAVRVTFMSMAPPPPPPPAPPAGGPAAARKLAPPPPPPPSGRRAAAPTVARPDDDDDEVAQIAAAAAGPGPDAGSDSSGDDNAGEDDGVKGGVAGGVSGGTPGGALGKTGGCTGAAEGPRSMPAQFGALQKESGDMPEFPDSLVRGTRVYAVETKICVSASGAVDSVTLTKRSDTLLDTNVINTVATWRFRPMTVNNAPVAFCYPVRFEFRSER